MHEASLMNALMKRIEELAAAEGADRVSGLGVWLGALSHMSPEHFREHFERASRDSVARDATLDIESSNDIDHPDAEGLRIRHVEVETS